MDEFNNKYIKDLSVIIVFLILFGCRPDISKYDGDGNISQTGWDILSYGYNIDFDKFDLTEPFHKKYRVSNLPVLKDIYSIGLCVNSNVSGDDLKKALKGTLSIKLINQKNQFLVDCSAPLNKWIYEEKWLATHYELFAYILEDNMSSCFSFNNIKGEMLFLSVDYDPKNTEEKIFGSVRFEVGGSY